MSHDDHEAHHVNYVLVFAALCVFTALSVVFDVLSFENHAVTVVLVMAVAVAKAMCVMAFFMHLKFEGNWKYVLLVPTTILAIGLPLALMPDIGVVYYTSTAPQHGEWGEQMEEYRAAHGHSEGHGEDHSEDHSEDHADNTADDGSGEGHPAAEAEAPEDQ